MENLLLHSTGFTIFNITISWYGFIIACAMIIGILVATYICKIKKYDLSLPIDLAIFALPCAIIGARLYYCIFNGVDSFVQIFEIWNGGMAIYGGVIGGFLGILLCCLIHKYSLAQCCDLAAPCLILGQAIGRIGCYFAGCCYGIETTIESFKMFPLSVKINGVWHLSTFFYESFFDLIGFFVLMLLVKKTKEKGIVTSWYLIIYGVIRFLLEGIRDDSAALFLGNSGIKVSQLLSALLILTGIVMFVIIIVMKKRKGVKSGKF